MLPEDGMKCTKARLVDLPNGSYFIQITPRPMHLQDAAPDDWRCSTIGMLGQPAFLRCRVLAQMNSAGANHEPRLFDNAGTDNGNTCLLNACGGGSCPLSSPQCATSQRLNAGCRGSHIFSVRMHCNHAIYGDCAGGNNLETPVELCPIA